MPLILKNIIFLPILCIVPRFFIIFAYWNGISLHGGHTHLPPFHQKNPTP